jgi:hypothetical protein
MAKAKQSRSEKKARKVGGSLPGDPRTETDYTGKTSFPNS